MSRGACSQRCHRVVVRSLGSGSLRDPTETKVQEPANEKKSRGGEREKKKALKMAAETVQFVRAESNLVTLETCAVLM